MAIPAPGRGRLNLLQKRVCMEDDQFKSWADFGSFENQKKLSSQTTEIQPIKSKTFLSFEESFYLVHVVGILEVVSTSNPDNVYSTQELFNLFCSHDQNFFGCYCVYQNLRNRGFVVKHDTNFGAQFVIYPKDVKSSHATAAVFITQEGIESKDLMHLMRLNDNVGKELILCKLPLNHNQETSISLLDDCCNKLHFIKIRRF